MDTVDPIFALVAVNPLLAAVVLPVYFALSVWSTHRVVHFLHSWSATQTAKRCDRWAQECEGAPASSWWQLRHLSFVFPSQTYRSRFCRDIEKFEACPKYAQELRLMTVSAAAAASEDATPESASAFSNAHHTGKGESPCLVNLGTTIRKGTGKAWREIRATVKRVGAVAKCAWSQAREKVYTTVLKKTGTRPTIGSGSAGGSGSSNSVVCVHSPAPPRKTASHEDRILAAQRVLRGSDTAGAVRLAFGLNTSFFVIAGLRFYLLKSRGGRLRSREWRRRWRRWQQRGNGGNRGGMVVRGDAANDNGSSTVGDSLLQARDSVAAASRRLRASEPCLSWGDWDDASLRSFMAEEARTSSHPAQRLLQLEEFHHHAALPRLARQWNVPFLSKADFLRQREAAQTLDHVIGDNGRLEPRRRGPAAATTKGGTRMGIRARNRRRDPANGRDGGVTALSQRRDERHRERHRLSEQQTPPRAKPQHTANPRHANTTTPPRLEHTTNMRSDHPPRPEPTSPPVGDGSDGGSVVVAAAAEAAAEAFRFFYEISSPIRLSAGAGWGVIDSREEGGGTGMREQVRGGGRERSGVSKIWSSGQQRQQGDGTQGGAGDRDEDTPLGRQEQPVHRAEVWKWEYCKGVAVYAVEVEVLGQSHARNVYRRYSHFLQLWEDVCQTHNGVRDFAFPSTGAVSSARSAFSEVLGEKRLEEQRRAKFCELLDVLMKLEPRPPALRNFLAPWPTEGTASSSGSPGLARDRRNREGHQQQGRAREEHGGSWAGTRTPKNRGGGGGGGGAGGSENASFGGIGLNGRVSDTRRKDQRQQLLLGGIAVGGLPVTPDRAPRNDRNRGSASTNRQAGVAAHSRGGISTNRQAGAEATGTAEEQSAVPLPRDLRLWVFLAFVGVLEACAALRAVGVTALSLPVTLALTAIAPAVAAVAFSVSSHARPWPSQQQRWQQQGRRKLSRPPQVDADSGGVLRGRETSVSFGRLPRQSHSLGGVAAAAAAAVGLGGLFGGGSGAGGGAGGGGSGGGAADGAGLGGVGAAAAAAVGLGAPGGTRRRSDTSSSPTRGRAPRGARRRSPARPSVGRREGECVNGLAAGTSSPPVKTAVGGVRAVAVTVPSGIAQELQME